MLLLGRCPFKIQKEKWVGLQFTSADGMNLVSTPLRIRWTKRSNESNAIIIGVYFNTSRAEVITVTLKVYASPGYFYHLFRYCSPQTLCASPGIVYSRSSIL